MMKSTSRVRGALIVWITSYVFFIVTLVNNFSAAHDSIHYLKDIVRGENLFHQHHLLYHFLANKWLSFWTGFFGCGVHSEEGLLFCRPHYVVEAFTALWGSSVLTIVYLFFRNRFYLTRISCLLGTAVVAFSYGVWFYSVNIEVYMPPLFFILWCLYILSGRDYSKKDVWKIAVLHSLAILFHQANVLFALVVIYALINGGMFRSVFKYALTGISITVGTYFFIGWIILGHNSMTGWLHWLQGYTVGHDYWQPLSARTPLHVFAGFAHAFVGAHFIFKIPAVEQYLERSFQSHGLKDEVFLASDISSNTAWALAGIAVVAVIIVISLLIRFTVHFRAMKLHSRVIAPLLICFVVYSIFFTFWMPEILEFWILQMVIAWLLLIGMLPLIRFPFRIKQNTGLAILAIAMFSLNFFGSMRWLQHGKYDWYIVETRKIAPSIKPGDIVVVENEWILKDYLRYYTPATVIATDEPWYNKEVADKAVSEALREGNNVFYYRNNELIQSY